MTEKLAGLRERFEEFRKSTEESLIDGYRHGHIPMSHTCGHEHLPVTQQITFFDAEGRRGSIGGFELRQPEALEVLVLVTRFGFEPEYAVFHHDAFTPTNPINPDTGRPWTLDEIYEEGNREGFGFRGRVSDCLSVEIVEQKTGLHYQRAMPYRISKDDGLVFQPPVIHPYPSEWLIQGMAKPIPEDTPWSNLDAAVADPKFQWVVRLRAICDYFQKVKRLAMFEVTSRETDHPAAREVLAGYYGLADG